MNREELIAITETTDNYNFHSHTQFCDGRADIAAMAAAAADAGMEAWGVSPHSPICVESPCNMTTEDMEEYLAAVAREKERFDGRMRVLTSLEIDYISRDFGPHIDYFQNLPLDYRLGSVHFVPTQEGVPVDCDGSAERFARNLKERYHGDLRYVVEKYYEQVLTMLELGGFDIICHFDKIAGNAFAVDPAIEDQGWYEALVRDVISHAQSAGVLVEINTKAIFERERFYPADRWWRLLLERRLPLCVNSDAHYTEKVNLGRPEALARLRAVRKS